MRRMGLMAAGLLMLAASAGASDWAVGPRAALGWSQDTAYGASSFVPEMVYGAGVQVERGLGEHGFAAFDLGYDQAGRRSVSAFSYGPTVGTVDVHMTEDEVAEALLGGFRFGPSEAFWHPRAYAGYQFTQQLDLREDWSGPLGSGHSVLYADQDHRYRPFGILGLGVGLGKGDTLVVDFRAAQELEHQTGSIATAVYAKFQFGLTWLYRL
jgi:hypothetical protein